MGEDRRSHAQRQIDAEDRLTQALAELIAEQGFQRTTAAEIGERAGYSRAAVRDRYGSKDQLLLALHGRYEAELLADPAAPGPDSIVAFLQRFERFARDRPDWLRALSVVTFESVSDRGAFGDTVRTWMRTLEQTAVSTMTAQQAAGTLRADLDVALLAASMLDEAIGQAFRWTIDGDVGDYAKFLRRWRARLAVELSA